MVNAMEVYIYVLHQSVDVMVEIVCGGRLVVWFIYLNDIYIVEMQKPYKMISVNDDKVMKGYEKVKRR